MNEAWSFVIHGNPPAINSTYKIVHVRNKAGEPVQRLAKHAEVTIWQEQCSYLARSARPSGWQPARRVRVTIEWWAARKRDSDAGIKALLDGLAMGLGIDDACFLVTVKSNEVDKTDPRTIVTVVNE